VLFLVDRSNLGEQAALTDGPFGSHLKTSHYTTDGPRVIRLQNVGEGVFHDERAHISHSHFETLRKHEARAGDVVVAMLGETLPKACVVPNYLGPAAVKAACVRLRVKADIALPNYVAAALNADRVRRQASSLMHGVGRPRLGLARFRDLELARAPFPEQRRIVECLDSYLPRLDEAEAALERVQRNLKRYRAAVLQAAVEGRLVPTEAELARAEGRTYEPASVQLERIRVARAARARGDDAVRVAQKR
jgi:type I restriction enzyme S subunit